MLSEKAQQALRLSIYGLGFQVGVWWDKVLFGFSVMEEFKAEMLLHLKIHPVVCTFIISSYASQGND